MGWTDRFPNVRAFAASHPRVALLIKNVLEGPGASEAELRQAAALSGPTPPVWTRYLVKLANHAYRVTDEDVGALKAVASEDCVLEVSVAGALGAALTRLEAGLAASRASNAGPGQEEADAT